jgi:hypothetical protein
MPPRQPLQQPTPRDPGHPPRPCHPRRHRRRATNHPPQRSSRRRCPAAGPGAANLLATAATTLGTSAPLVTPLPRVLAGPQRRSVPPVSPTPANARMTQRGPFLYGSLSGPSCAVDVLRRRAPVAKEPSYSPAFVASDGHRAAESGSMDGAPLGHLRLIQPNRNGGGAALGRALPRQETKRKGNTRAHRSGRPSGPLPSANSKMTPIVLDLEGEGHVPPPMSPFPDPWAARTVDRGRAARATGPAAAAAIECLGGGRPATPPGSPVSAIIRATGHTQLPESARHGGDCCRSGGQVRQRRTPVLQQAGRDDFGFGAAPTQPVPDVDRCMPYGTKQPC